MTIQEARDLVDDLCDACLAHERAASAQSRKAGEHYHAMFERVVQAIVAEKQTL